MSSSTLHQSHRRLAVSCTRQRPRRTLANAGWTTLMVVVGLAYLFVVNDCSTKGYEIRSLRTQSNTLAEHIIRVKSQTAFERSRAQVAAQVKLHPFVPEGVVEYARPASPVALQMLP